MFDHHSAVETVPIEVAIPDSQDLTLISFPGVRGTDLALPTHISAERPHSSSSPQQPEGHLAREPKQPVRRKGPVRPRLPVQAEASRKLKRTFARPVVTGLHPTLNVVACLSASPTVGSIGSGGAQQCLAVCSPRSAPHCFVVSKMFPQTRTTTIHSGDRCRAWLPDQFGLRGRFSAVPDRFLVAAAENASFFKNSWRELSSFTGRVPRFCSQRLGNGVSALHNQLFLLAFSALRKADCHLKQTRHKWQACGQSHL